MFGILTTFTSKTDNNIKYTDRLSGLSLSCGLDILLSLCSSCLMLCAVRKAAKTNLTLFYFNFFILFY